MSATKHADTAKILKEILRLNLARQDFIGVQRLAEKLLAHPVHPSNLIFRPLMAGIDTTYSRSFGQNDGIRPLGKSFTVFNDRSLDDTHGKLLRLRHGAYAHRDTSAVGTFTGTDTDKSYQLQIRFDDSENPSLCSNAPELDPENLQNVVKLCSFQSQRALDAARKLLALVTKGKKYAPGTYTAGVDFP